MSELLAGETIPDNIEVRTLSAGYCFGGKDISCMASSTPSPTRALSRVFEKAERRFAVNELSKSERALRWRDIERDQGA